MAVSSAFGHLPHQKISRLPQVGDVPLIIQQVLLNIFWGLLAYRRPAPQRQPHSTQEHYGPSFTGFKTTSRNVQRSGLFLSTPCEVDHNLQTVRSCVSHERTWRLHRQFQEIVLSWVQWISFVTPQSRWSLLYVSATVELDIYFGMHPVYRFPTVGGHNPN